jgi:hypothetical protein
MYSYLSIYEPGYLSGVALSCGLDYREFESRQGLGNFLFTTASRPVPEPTQISVQWVPRALSLAVKSGRGVMLTAHLHLVPRSKNAWSYTSTSPIHFYGLVLI